jgi:hypothetical protein
MRLKPDQPLAVVGWFALEAHRASGSVAAMASKAAARI